MIAGVAEKVNSLKSAFVEKINAQASGEISRLETGIKELRERLTELQSERDADQNKIKVINEKLNKTEEGLIAFKKMPFWQRVKYLFKPESS